MQPGGRARADPRVPGRNRAASAPCRSGRTAASFSRRRAPQPRSAPGGLGPAALDRSRFSGACRRRDARRSRSGGKAGPDRPRRPRRTGAGGRPAGCGSAHDGFGDAGRSWSPAHRDRSSRRHRFGLDLRPDIVASDRRRSPQRLLQRPAPLPDAARPVRQYPHRRDRRSRYLAPAARRPVLARRGAKLLPAPAVVGRLLRPQLTQWPSMH
jgi:hypothetical protein